MKSYLMYFSLLAITLIFIYLIGGFVIIFATVLVLFEKCLFGRIAIIPGIEFITLATILVAMKYEPIIGILFCVFVGILIPSAINVLIGDKGIANPGFQLFSIGFGNIVDIVCVLVIYLLRGFDILWIMLIVLIIKHTLNNLSGKLKELNFILDYFGIFMNILFNLSIIFFFHSFWLSLL